MLKNTLFALLLIPALGFAQISKQIDKDGFIEIKQKSNEIGADGYILIKTRKEFELLSAVKAGYAKKTDESAAEFFKKELLGTNDAFERRKIENNLFPEYYKLLSLYESNDLYKLYSSLPGLRNSELTNVQPATAAIRSYDFKNSGFPFSSSISSCGPRMREINFMVGSSPTLNCYLKVDDESLAKYIESLVSNGKAKITTLSYFEVKKQTNAKTRDLYPKYQKVEILLTDTNFTKFSKEGGTVGKPIFESTILFK